MRSIDPVAFRAWLKRERDALLERSNRLNRGGMRTNYTDQLDERAHILDALMKAVEVAADPASQLIFKQEEEQD